MSRLILIISLFIATASTAQVGKWSIGLTSSITKDYRVLIPDNSFSSEFIKSHRDDVETPITSYRAGILVNRKLKGPYSVETGLIISRRGYKWYSPVYKFEDQIDPSTGFSNSSSELWNKNELLFKDIFQYLEIPITIKRTLKEDYPKINVGAGLSMDLLISSPENYTFRPINISSHVQFGTDLRLGSNGYLSLDGFYRIGISNIIATPLTAKLWTAGVSVGYFRSF